MKVLIWFGCIAVYSVVITVLRFAGILLGGIPTALLALLMVLLPAPVLCKQWDKHKARNTPPRRPPEEEAPIDVSKIENPILRARAELLCAGKERPSASSEEALPPPHQEGCNDTPIERWYTCQKCGQLVREGAVCDCDTVRQRLETHHVAAPVAQEQEQTGAELSKKRKRSTLEVGLMIVCGVLIFSVAILGYYVHEFRTLSITAIEYNDDLLRENKALEAKNEELQLNTEDLQSRVSELEESNYDLSGYMSDAFFLYNKIGFIVRNSNRYHSYECPIFQEADEYWAHNVEYCEYLGYAKCGNCW